MLAGDYFYIEAERAEAVVAAYHGAHGVLHPSVVEITLASGQRLYKLLHGAPGGRAHTLWTFTINRNPLLTFFYIAGMLYGILVFLHKVGIYRLPNSRNSYLIHLFAVINLNYFFVLQIYEKKA